MKKLGFLMVSAIFIMGCGGGGSGSGVGTPNILTGEYAAIGDILAHLPIEQTDQTVQGGTIDEPTPLSPLEHPVSLDSIDVVVTHKFGTDMSNNYFEYTAQAGETLIIAITFDKPLTEDKMSLSPQFLEVYDSLGEQAEIIPDGGSGTFTEVYMVYAIKFPVYDTYILQFGWEGHSGYATIASID